MLKSNLIIVHVVLLVILTGNLYSQQKEFTSNTFSGNAEVNIHSLYLWRGIPSSDGFVTQIPVTFSVDFFYLSVFTNYELSKIPSRRFNEFDISLGHTFSAADIDFDLSIDYYYYPTSTEFLPATFELYSGLSYSVSYFLLSFEQSLDLDEYFGAYSFTADFEYPLQISDQLQFSTAAGFTFLSSEFNKAYIGYDKSLLNDFHFSFSSEYSFNENFYVLAGVAFYHYNDDTVKILLERSSASDIFLSFGCEF